MKSDKKTYAEKKISAVNVDSIIKTQFEQLTASLKRELLKIEEINAAVIFGSFARGDYSIRHSDIDIMIFIDKTDRDAQLEEKILKKVIGLNLGKELNIHTLFQYKKIEEEDKSLMLTLSNEGKVLFAKKSIIISNNILGLKNYYLLQFDVAKTEPVIKNKLQRFLYGYMINGKRYKGLVDSERVISAGKGAIVVPEELLKKVLLFCQSIGIKAAQKAKFYR